jgi:hypothetical protein
MAVQLAKIGERLDLQPPPTLRHGRQV